MYNPTHLTQGPLADVLTVFLGFPLSLLTKTSQSSDVKIVAFEIVKRKLNYNHYELFFHPRIFFRDCSSFFMFDEADSSNLMK